MANFNIAFKLTMLTEGGYVFDTDDLGGETYKGVARTRNPKWSGWCDIDFLKTKRNFPENLYHDTDLQTKIKNLYVSNYWDRIRGDDIEDQDIAESIFDFAVNAGPRTSTKLAQLVVNAEPDGVLGPNTLRKINAEDKRVFLATFALAKIGRYVRICEQRSSNRKYFFGWIRRTLGGI